VHSERFAPPLATDAPMTSAESVGPDARTSELFYDNKCRTETGFPGLAAVDALIEQTPRGLGRSPGTCTKR